MAPALASFTPLGLDGLAFPTVVMLVRCDFQMLYLTLIGFHALQAGLCQVAALALARGPVVATPPWPRACATEVLHCAPAHLGHQLLKNLPFKLILPTLAASKCRLEL